MGRYRLKRTYSGRGVETSGLRSIGETMENTLEAYIDGSSIPRPRRGGIGVRFVRNDEDTGEEIIIDLSPPGWKEGTNQEMEILACTTALRESLKLELPKAIRRLVILSDSDYVCKGYRYALFVWPRTKWEGRFEQPIENGEDWEELGKWYKKAKDRFEVIRIEWIEKNSSPHNKAAHRLAKGSARNAVNAPRKVVHSARKRSQEVVDRGSVKMEGQDLTIYVTESKLLRLQKVWRATYEVVDPDSPYCGKRDRIIAPWSKRLDRGHTYRIRVNDDNKNPRVEELYGEVLPPEEEEKGGA